MHYGFELCILLRVAVVLKATNHLGLTATNMYHVWLHVTHATAEVHHEFAEGGHVRSSIPHPQTDLGGK